MAYLNRSGTEVSLGSSVTTTMYNPTGWSGIQLSSSRNLVSSANITDGDLEFIIVNTSGSSPVEEDYAQIEGNYQLTAQAVRIDDNNAIVTARKDNTECYTTSVNTASDSISFTSSIVLGSGDNGTGFAAANLDGTNLIVFCGTYAYHVTYSGGNLTDEGESILIRDDGVSAGEKWAFTIDSDTSAIFYRSNASYWVNDFTLSGGTLSKGTPVQIQASTIAELTGFVTEIQNGLYFTGVSGTGNGINGYVVSYDSVNGFVVQQGPTQIGSASISSDHTNVIRMGLDYIGLAYQDETTTPIQQIGARIITP